MRTLVAGLGNIFHGDDGFGVEVAAVLLRQDWPEDVQVADFGIRGIHLAYQLLDAYEIVVIVDAVSRGGEPGTLYVIDHQPDEQRSTPSADAPVLALVPALGGRLGRVVVVGCEPDELRPGVGLSAPVAASVEPAARLVTQLVWDARAADTDALIGGERR
jgi:hydrogenase maturation protease